MHVQRADSKGKAVDNFNDCHIERADIAIQGTNCSHCNKIPRPITPEWLTYKLARETHFCHHNITVSI